MQPFPTELSMREGPILPSGVGEGVEPQKHSGLLAGAQGAWELLHCARTARTP